MTKSLKKVGVNDNVNRLMGCDSYYFMLPCRAAMTLAQTSVGMRRHVRACGDTHLRLALVVLQVQLLCLEQRSMR